MLTAKRICQFVATTAEVSYYTTPATTTTVLKQCIVANTTAIPQTLGLSVVPAGNVAGNANRIIPGTSIPGNSSVVLDITTVLAAGDFISAIGSANNALTVTISGLEAPGSNGASTGSTLATPLAWGSPVALNGQSNADGVSTLLSRADHQHQITPLIDSGWVAVTAFLNGWVNYPGFPPAAYRRFNDLLFLKGLIRNGTVTNNTPVYQLPVGYRPLLTQHIPTVSNDVASFCRVQGDGYVTIGANVSASWFSLDGVVSVLT